MIQPPKEWKLETNHPKELIWKHKHGVAFVRLTWGRSECLLTIYDPREDGIGKTEGKYPKDQKNEARQLAIEYMLMHP